MDVSILREIRKGLGWTQGYVSELVGISVSHLGDVERGERGISLELLEKLVIAYKFEIVLCRHVRGGLVLHRIGGNDMRED